MSTTAKAFLWSLAAVVVAGAVSADTEVSVTGQVRARWELDDRSFDTATITQEYTDLRTRVTVEAVVDGNTRAVVQFQDSRRLGGLNQFGDMQSAGLNDSKNVDVHQAYVQVDRLWQRGPGFRAGRFEINLGNERVFGAVGWSNIGRSWEGAQLWYDNEDWSVALSRLKAVERNKPTGNEDFDAYVVTVGVPQAGLSLFGALEHDARLSIDTIDNDLDRISIGGYFVRQFEGTPLDVEVNAVYQAGDMAGTDIKAFLFTGELGYTFPGRAKMRIAAAVDYASGDDTTADNEINAYYNMYYTGHKFRGYMDYFAGSGAPVINGQTPGLIDMIFRAKASPDEGWTVKGDVHLFKAAQEYRGLNGQLTSNIGTEIDLTVVTTRVPGVKLQGGLSFFLPDDSFAGMTDPDNGLWSYLMATVDF